MTKKEFMDNSAKGRNIVIPTDLSRIKYNLNECVIYFPKTTATKWFLGIGLIKSITHEQHIDYVEIVFNCIGYGNKVRKLVVGSNDARKQVQTLRINEFALVYGVCPNDKSVFKVYCFFPSFVPTAFDIKHADNEPQEEWEWNEDDEREEIPDLLDILQGGKKSGK